MPLWPRRTCRCWLVYKVTISLGSLLELDFGTLPELNAVGGWCLIAFRLESWGYSDKTAKRYTAYNLGQNGPMYRCPVERHVPHYTSAVNRRPTSRRHPWLNPPSRWIKIRAMSCSSSRVRKSQRSARRPGRAQPARLDSPSALALGLARARGR